MVIRTGYMRIVGVLLLLAALIDAIALNWNTVSANVCQQLGTSAPGCGPINYTVPVVLACVGVGLIVVSMFVRGDQR